MVTNLKPKQAVAPATLKDRVAKDAVAEATRQYLAILPTSDPKAIEVQLAIRRAFHALYLSNCRAVDALGLPVSVTGKRLAILRTLYFAPERQMTLSAVSKIVRVSPAAATNYVDSLSRGSLVRRTCSPEDRHSNIIQLTPKGEAAFQGIASALSRSWTEACAGFTADEKDTLVRLLERLF